MPITINGTGPIDGITSLNTTVSSTELGFLDGVTSAIQTQFGNIGTWQTYTPSWTNLNVGNGTVTARYTQIGKAVISTVRFIYGSTSSISGSLSFTLPVTSINYSSGDVLPIGNATMHDFGAALFWGSVLWLSTTTASVYPYGAATTYVNLAASMSSTVPMTWAASDSLNMIFCYEAA